MPNFFSFLGRKKIPSKEDIVKIAEKPFTIYGLVFFVLALSFLIILYILLIKINSLGLKTIAARGGMVVEGVIGAPRFINPILAKTETDMSLASLLYSGLMKEGEDGNMIPSLAEKYEISPDGTIYTFTIKNNVFFSDGKPLTSEDIAFTFKKLTSPILNGDKSVYWQNIIVETLGQNTISFTIPKPDPEFLSYTTVGILPSHIWGNIENEDFEKVKQNLSPIGTGVFKYHSIEYEDGVPKEIVLKRNNKNKIDRPYLDEFRVSFFANEEELVKSMSDKEIDITLFISSKYAQTFSEKKFDIQKINTTKLIALHRLKNEKHFSNAKFASIINQFLDKNSIIDKVEGSYGTLSNNSVPISLEQAMQGLKEMKYVLKDGVLQKDSTPVDLGIAIENSQDMLLLSKEIATQLEKLGIKVTIKSFDHGAFLENIADKKYEIFLSNHDDVFIPQDYENIISLYTKNIPLIKNKDVFVNIPSSIKNPKLRYTNINDWYTKTDKVWKFFKK